MAKSSTVEDELHEVQHMVSRERLSLDEPSPDRTCFLSHVGAQPKLAPGPWIGHRDLVYAMALANLSPAQRTSLARAVLIEHGRQFGVGRLTVDAVASDLPLGGTSLRLAHRKGGLRVLYTWGLGMAPGSAPCDWMLLRAQAEWALEPAHKPLSAKGMQTLTALGGGVLVLVDTAVAARQVVQACGDEVTFQAHPRFSPYIENLDPEGKVVLWPHDAIGGAGLARHSVVATVLVSAPEPVREGVEAWRKGLGDAGERMHVVEVGCPDRIDRPRLAAFWETCGRPRILLRGDSQWSSLGAAWLRELGATVQVQGRATQLSLI